MANPDEQTKRVMAFLSLLRYAEQGKREVPDAYFRLFGRGSFGSTKTHPNVKHTRWGYTSTAAGAYMITKETYDLAVRNHVVHDFSSISQDKIALWLIQKNDALSSVQNGQFADAFSQLRRVWSSLPGGAQQEISGKDAEDYLKNNVDATP